MVRRHVINTETGFYSNSQNSGFQDRNREQPPVNGHEIEKINS